MQQVAVGLWSEIEEGRLAGLRNVYSLTDSKVECWSLTILRTDWGSLLVLARSRLSTCTCTCTSNSLSGRSCERQRMNVNWSRRTADKRATVSDDWVTDVVEESKQTELGCGSSLMMPFSETFEYQTVSQA